MAKACAWCAAPYEPRTREHRFCSRRCAGLYQYRDHPRRVHHWRKRVSVDNEHRRLRARLLPAAIGQPCPLCGTAMRAEYVDLDHILPRAQGGRSVPGNCRIVCRACNRRRGQQLGGRQAAARRHRPHPRAEPPPPRANPSRAW